MIKKHKSTVLSLAWCVNNKFLVTGSADMKCRVFSAYLDNLDPAEDDGFGEVWPNQHQFGEVLCEFDQARAWVHSVAWSPGGFRLAFAGHGSTVHFVQILAGSQPVVQSVSAKDLPYLDMQFLNDNCLVAAGFDFNIDQYSVTGGSDSEPVWSFKDKVDKANSANSAAKPAAGGAFGASRAMFGAMVDKGTSTTTVTDAATKHKNIIVNIQTIRDANFNAIKFTTAGIDGRILVWSE
jgi:actin related protein 2/3 complex subunit 1A/1B